MTVKELFATAVKAAINGDVNHGWGQEDSAKVVFSIVEHLQQNGPQINEVDEQAKAARDAIKKVINPSAFRQAIEGTADEVKAGKALIVKKEGSRKSAGDIMSGLGI